MNGIAMDADLNRYDLEHVCTSHRRMSTQEWERIYQEAWRLYYTPDHMKTLLKRAAATGVPMRSLATLLFLFATTMQLERVHPLQGGILRLKHPSELRPGLRRPPAWRFWLQFLGGSVAKYARMIATYVRVARWRRAVERDPVRHVYMDQALSSVGDEEEEDTLDLLTKTAGGLASVAQARKVAGRPRPVPAAEQGTRRPRSNVGAGGRGSLG
jgi:hypothetical protein